MTDDTAVDSILHDMEREPLARRLQAYVARAASPRKSMPDCVRSLPKPSLYWMYHAGSLTVCKPLS